MILDAFQVEFSQEKLNGLLLSVAAGILIHIVLIPLTRILRRPLSLTPVERTSIIYSNGGNLIVPLVTYALGPEWVLYTSGFTVVQICLFWTHCIVILNNKSIFSLRNILLNTNIIAIGIGSILFMTGLRLPEIPRMAVHSVGAMIGPLSMIVTGMIIGALDLHRLKEYRKLPLIAALRLAGYPLIILLVFQASGMVNWTDNGHTVLLISFLAAAAPSASTVTQMAQLYGQNGEYASLINMTTTILCVMTMPVLVYLFQTIM